MKSNFYCFSRNGKHYALDIIRLIPLQLSPEAYSILNKMQGTGINVELSKYCNNDGFSDIQALANQEILFHSSQYEVVNSFRELNISLIPALSCNLNCKYCYSSRKSENLLMRTENVRDAINFFCENYSFAFCRVDFVSGGEPLYNSKSLINIIDILSDTLKQYDKKSLFWLCTNGLLLNDQILQYLDSKNFNIGISIDGPEDINDANRIDMGGNGTYKKVVKKIMDIQNNHNLSRNIKNLWNCAVITSKTRSLVDVLKNSYQLGFRNLQMKIAWTNDDKIRLSDDQTLLLYNELSDYLFELIEDNKIEEFLSICNENDTYGKLMLRIIIQSGVTRRCNAGVNKFSVSPEGKLYPCDSFLGVEEYCIGNVYTGFNKTYDEFNNTRNDNIEKCKNCWARYVCGGDCFYHAYLNTGSPWIPDDKVCHIMKETTKMCIGLVVDLYRSFPEKMQRIYSILSKKAVRMEPKT